MDTPRPPGTAVTVDPAADPLAPYYARVDRMLLAVLAGCVAFAVALSTHFGGTPLALGVGLPVLGATAALVAARPGRLVTRLVVAIAFMAVTALQIQIARGLVELHFGVFVSLAFLLAYRDWRPVPVAAGAIAVHHVAFNAMQAAGWGVYCLSEASWSLTVLHAAYVLAQAGVQVLLARRLEHDARLGAELQRITESMRGGNGQVRLDLADVAVDTPLARDLHGALDRIGATLREVAAAAESVRIGRASCRERVYACV